MYINMYLKSIHTSFQNTHVNENVTSSAFLQFYFKDHQAFKSSCILWVFLIKLVTNMTSSHINFYWHLIKKFTFGDMPSSYYMWFDTLKLPLCRIYISQSTFGAIQNGLKSAVSLNSLANLATTFKTTSAAAAGKVNTCYHHLQRSHLRTCILLSIYACPSFANFANGLLTMKTTKNYILWKFVHM